jgi:hypothetical protein
MTPNRYDALSVALAGLQDLPETSHALRRYLSESLERDPVDVLNEIEILARVVAEHAPEDGSFSSRSS